MVYALIDCNNFFASCEKLANPKLEGKPIVVASGVDGIVVARSKEAKALGIPMGAALFEWRDIVSKYNVYVATSNFHLYGQVSRHVMQTLKSFGYDTEIYSVDEAFLRAAAISHEEATWMKEEVKRKTGIDVSVGVAPTKTLAKAANFFAKQKPELQGVMVMDDIERALKEMPVEEVWGIGRKIATRLRRHQIYTAWDLSQQPDDSIRKILSVVGLRMAFELRGTPCLGFHEFREPKKSISTARSFKQREKLIENIEPILASYVEQIAHELRSEKQLASTLTVWIETNPFGKDEYYSQAAAHVFSEPTAFTPEMIRVAKELLQGIFREGFSYKKVGIMVSDLVPQGSFQRDFLKETDDAAFHRQQKLMKLVDEMNETFGKKTLYFGAQM